MGKRCQREILDTVTTYKILCRKDSSTVMVTVLLEKNFIDFLSSLQIYYMGGGDTDTELGDGKAAAVATTTVLLPTLNMNLSTSSVSPRFFSPQTVPKPGHKKTAEPRSRLTASPALACRTLLRFLLFQTARGHKFVSWNTRHALL
jgi:hypothetical protein